MIKRLFSKLYDILVTNQEAEIQALKRRREAKCNVDLGQVIGMGFVPPKKKRG